MVIGYFITFSTYGTWLHGSEKGSVDRQHNVYGEALVETNPRLEKYRRTLLTQPPVILDVLRRQFVLNAIRDHCRFRGWFLWAAHVRTNHVHIVVGTDREAKSPEQMMTEFKAYASREIRSRTADASNLKYWTRHGSTRHLSSDDSLNRAIYYTVYEQGERMDVFEAPRS